MTKKQTSTSNQSIDIDYTKKMGFLDWLQISFIVLKLVGEITWSWVWVLSPLWIVALLALAVWIITPKGY